MKHQAFSMHSSWQSFLEDFFKQEETYKLLEFIDKAYASKPCFPPKHQIFRAFDCFAVRDLKVVIIGQDPYHDFGQANGLCFAVNEGVAFPPSLKNIIKEVEADTGKKNIQSGDLLDWAAQGVLLLNDVLTVEAHQAASHQKYGWEAFTKQVIQKISTECDGIVFMLWGGSAKKKAKLIDQSKHCVLTSGHPSPLSANRGYWYGNKHFSKANTYLSTVGKSEIVW